MSFRDYIVMQTNVEREIFGTVAQGPQALLARCMLTPASALVMPRS